MGLAAQITVTLGRAAQTINLGQCGVPHTPPLRVRI